MKEQCHSLIKERLAEGKTQVEIAQELHVSKQRVHQIIKEANISMPIPKGYITVKQFAAKLSISYRWAQQIAFAMPSLKWGKQRFVPDNIIPRPCRRCGKNRGHGTRYCPTCSPIAREEAHKKCMWRSWFRRQGRKIPRSLQLELRSNITGSEG